MNNWGMVVGPAQLPDIAPDGLAVNLVQNDQVVTAGSSAPDVLDYPYPSLARVCRELDAFRLGPGARAQAEPDQHGQLRLHPAGPSPVRGGVDGQRELV
jgi:hypothetical protein